LKGLSNNLQGNKLSPMCFEEVLDVDPGIIHKEKLKQGRMI